MRPRTGRLVFSPRSRRFLASTLVLVLLSPVSLAGAGSGAVRIGASGSPSPFAVSPRYVARGDDLLRIDAGSFHDALGSLAAGGGQGAIEIRLAIFEGEDRLPDAFEFGDVDGPDAFRVVGSARDDALTDLGRAEAELVGWEPLVRLEVESDAAGTTLRFVVGPDTIETYAPRALLDPWRTTGTVFARVNGREARLEFSENGVTTAAGEAPGLLDALSNRDRTLDRIRGFAELTRGMIDGPFDLQGSNKWGCIRCLAAIGAYGLGLATLVVACSGTAGLGCVIAFGGITLGKVHVIVSCGQCMEELEEGEGGSPSWPPTGGGDCTMNWIDPLCPAM